MARGRRADAPNDIPASGWKDIALRVRDEISNDHVSLISAGIAFYGLLALVPGLTAALALSGLIIEPAELVAQLQTLEGLVPAEALAIITSQAEEIASGQTEQLGLAALIGAAIALYSASKGMRSLMEGLNIAYDEDEKRGFFVKTLVTLALTLFVVIGILVILTALIATPVVLETLRLGAILEAVITIAVWLVLLVAFMVGLAILYRFAPSRAQPRWQWVSVGAIVATVVWIVASAGFAFYVANFASYNETFGALGGVVILLMWFWLSSFVVLAGAELNAEMEAQTRRDTTTGEPEPMGERGAVKADNLGAAAGQN